ncbi:glutamate decarboxylase [Vibrio breoganii]|uniref:glutamate decarboxylase n=1 Tax=Vibrio breoganii TaxID=553239 RepID=UPI0002DDD9C5|nr:glutamate decarboxylase [Vibrio breoganii]OED83200.1 glutamate decarboxylase [Vibrio breoganii ZF-55]OED94214.1 glutamate decarboxylase [Vibrio breoganii ZF-29]OEF84296.1 glutamate decarboxylase [Vibrio breoganii 1C10]PML28257.1 glutamate decarboxylase [Vibrio breoganii]PMO53519.1 glutamate decarboxylase [Vibrio breoganii]
MSHEKHSDLNPYEQFNIQLPDAFPEEGMAARAAEALVRSECWTDANPNLNLSSFVTTFMEPEAAEIFKDGSFRNFADPDMYPHTKATEEKCVRWLHELWNGPKDVEPYGAATIGSSEACMLAGLAHKWNWRQAREKAGKDASKPNMVTGGNVQIVWKKFLKYFDVEPRIVPLKPGQYTLTAEQLDEYVDENTICVVGIAGQTFTGEDDDFQAIHDWLDAYEEQTGISIPMHIDAASGGFVNPFLYPEYEWDFRLPRVKSINASGHKFGLVPPGLGWIIFREREVFNEDLVFYVNYLGGEAATATLNFSKSSATVLAQYYNFIRLGREGYTRIMKQTVENAEYIRDRLVATGKFKIMNETQRIPVVALTLNESVTNYNEFDISNKVREHGWILSAYSMPANAQQVNSLRIVVRPHLNRDAAEILVGDIERACEFLEEHGGNATPPKLHDLHKVSSGKC